MSSQPHYTYAFPTSDQHQLYQLAPEYAPPFLQMPHHAETWHTSPISQMPPAPHSFSVDYLDGHSSFNSSEDASITRLNLSMPGGHNIVSKDLLSVGGANSVGGLRHMSDPGSDSINSYTSSSESDFCWNQDNGYGGVSGPSSCSSEHQPQPQRDYNAHRRHSFPWSPCGQNYNAFKSGSAHEPLQIHVKQPSISDDSEIDELEDDVMEQDLPGIAYAPHHPRTIVTRTVISRTGLLAGEAMFLLDQMLTAGTRS